MNNNNNNNIILFLPPSRSLDLPIADTTFQLEGARAGDVERKFLHAFHFVVRLLWCARTYRAMPGTK